MFKKASSKLQNALSNPLSTEECITVLINRKNKLHKNARLSANESLKANRRLKDSFYNTVNATMNNFEISAKKKFSILLGLTKNKKYSNIPPLLENGQTINDSKLKREIFNKHFAFKASL